jgi:phage minor structural protein
MRPILFNKNEQSFDTYGLGELNVTKGTVTRERNGNYTLYAEIPVNDPMVSILEKEMKLKADAGLRTKNQTFEISRIVKDSSNIVKIYGQHISHKLEYMALRNATAFAGSAYSALGIWKGALIGDLRFDVWSDIQTVGKGVFDISKMANARQALGGVEGSILDIYGGEYEFDNMTVRLHKQLGRTAPTVLEYGRNILSAESDETIESAYTSVLPFATYTPDKPEGDTSDSQPDAVTVTLPEDYVDSKYKDLYAYRRIKIVDFSSEFKSDGKNKDIPTVEKLRKMATNYMDRNAIGKPKFNTKIEYADLARTLDYADRGWIEEVELCDIVPVYYPQIGLTDETLEITTITYDFVNERNENVEFGDIGTNVRATMQNGLAGRVDDIARAQQDFENSLPDYLLNAQGNKVWYNQPDDKEHKIGDIWFEKNGIYDRMYVWNGEMWEKRIDTEDIDKIKKEVDKQLEQAKQSTAIEIAKADAKAQEALALAGTIPDMPTLSEQIKAQVLNSADLSRKVTESLNQADGGVIYSKIFQNIKTDFVTQEDVSQALTGINEELQTQVVEFQKLTESNKIYERIIGKSETDAPDKLSRLVMSSQIFQTEVGQYVNTDGANLLNGSKGPFKPDKKPANFDNNILYKDSTSIYMEQGQEYIVSAKTDGNFTAHHDGNKESDNVVLWIMDKNVRNYQIVSDLKTGTTGTKIVWNKPTGTYHLRVNTYHKDPDKLKSVWNVKIEKGSIKSDYTLSLTDQLKADPLIEATRTQMTLLAGSWAIKNLNSNGDVLNSINVLANGTNRIDGRLTHITGQTVIDEAVIDSANLKKVSASKISGGEADFAKINVVNFDAKNVTSGTFQGLVFRGGRIEALNGKMNIDLQNGQYNVLSDDATIRRIDTNSSQFIKLTKSGFVAERFRDTNAALMVFGTNHNKDPKEVERHDNDTFAGIRVWSGKGNGAEESLTEFIGDRVLIYNNGRYRSPWNFHGNMNDGKTYLLPMNQNNVKHYIGRGDFFLEGIYSRHFYMSGGTDIGVYLWDLLTCLGMLKRHGTISGASGHIQGVLDKYGFR